MKIIYNLLRNKKGIEQIQATAAKITGNSDIKVVEESSEDGVMVIRNQRNINLNRRVFSKSRYDNSVVNRIGSKKLSARWVPRILKDAHKETSDIDVV